MMNQQQLEKTLQASQYAQQVLEKYPVLIEQDYAQDQGETPRCNI